MVATLACQTHFSKKCRAQIGEVGENLKGRCRRSAGLPARRKATAMKTVSAQFTSPRIAVALGGGVARGWAHIGALRALRAHGVDPDIVTGTSIGAVAAGAYAADKLDALEFWARSLTPRRVVSLLDFTAGGSGLFAGERLAALLDREIGGTLIEDLRIPFAAIATELKSGQEVWLRNGPLTRAMRASYALPAVFAPQPWEGMWLVDGALVNPCPISAARALGGRLVVGISLHSDIVTAEHADPAQMELALSGPSDTAGPFSVIGRWMRPDKLLLDYLFTDKGGQPAISTVMVNALNILLDRVTRARLAGDPPDILIAPKVAKFGLLEFHRAAELIQAGADAVHDAMPALKDAIRRLR
jgi:NTE family protein